MNKDAGVPMSSQDTTIKNPTGLHARPAAQLSAFCKQFSNDIRISSEERSSNPKSIFSLLSGGYKQGEIITVEVQGENAQETAAQIVSFIDALEG